MESWGGLWYGGWGTKEGPLTLVEDSGPRAKDGKGQSLEIIINPGSSAWRARAFGLAAFAFGRAFGAMMWRV